jgi:hypothetical protein
MYVHTWNFNKCVCVCVCVHIHTGRPLVAYFGSVVQDDKVTGNVATLAEVEEVMTDAEGKLTSVTLPTLAATH